MFFEIFVLRLLMLLVPLVVLWIVDCMIEINFQGVPFRRRLVHKFLYIAAGASAVQLYQMREKISMAEALYIASALAIVIFIIDSIMLGKFYKKVLDIKMKMKYKIIPIVKYQNKRNWFKYEVHALLYILAGVVVFSISV